MPGHHDLHAHLGGTLHDRVKVIYFKPEQHAVSVWFVIAVANGTVIVLNVEAMQLKDKVAIGDQPLILAAAMIAPAAQQSLIPPATCFHVGYGHERLRTHCRSA